MKKFSVLQSRLFKAGLMVGMLVPSVNFAEYDSYNTGFQKDASRVESILKPGISSSASGDSLSEQIEKNLLKVEQNLTQNKEELELRGKLRNWTKKNDKLKSLITLPDIIAQKAIRARELQIGEAEAMASRLGNTQNMTNPADFSMNGMPNACRKNVDFTQFMTLTQQLGSEPFKYLQGEASKLLEEKSKEAKQAKLQKINDLITHFKELANREDDGETLKADAFQGPNGIEARLEELKAKNKLKKEENKELKNSLVDVFGKFVQNLSGIEENDKRVAQLGDEFARSLENTQRSAMQVAQQNIDQLFSNCESEIKGLKLDIENFKGQLVARGYNPEVAELDAQAQRQRAANLQCTDVTSNVQSLLMGFGTGGSALSDRLAKVRAEKNPIRLLTEAVGAMQDVANIQAQVGQQLQPLMQDCADAGNGREGLKQRWQQLASATGGDQSGAAGASGSVGTPRNSSSRSGSNNGTHGSFVPGFGRVN